MRAAGAAAILFIMAAAAVAADYVCSIEGTIYNAATGEPVRKAVVTLRPADGVRAQGPGRAAISDTAGHYSITGVDPGAYRLFAERTGFIRQELGATRPGKSGTPVLLAAGENRKDADLRLTPQGVITGRVLDEDGDPAALVSVTLLRTGYAQGRKQLMPGGPNVTTNDQGEFRVFGLAPGRYYLMASYRPLSAEEAALTAEAYAPTFYPGAASADGAAPIDVAAGSVLRGIDIRLQRMTAVRVRGRVVDAATNDPVRGAIVMLSPRAGVIATPAAQRVVRVRGQALFEMDGITPGSYVLSAHANRDQQLSARMLLEVGQSDVNDLTLALTPGAEIAGVVKLAGGTGELPRGLRVQLEPASESGYPIAPVKQDGSFRMQHVQADTYSVRLYGLPDTAYVQEVRFGDAVIGESGLDFSRGFTPGELTITIAPTAAHVDGTVLDDKGQPFAGATVVIAAEKAKAITVRTDQSGRFSAGGLAPGDYRLWAFDDIDAGAWDDPEYMKPHDAQAGRVTVKDNDHQTAQLKLLAGRE